MPGVKVRKGAIVDKAIIGMNTIIGEGCNWQTGSPEPYYNKNFVLMRSLSWCGLIIKDNAIYRNCMVEQRQT